MLAELLASLLTAPDAGRAADELHRRLAELNGPPGSVLHVALGVPIEDPGRARALARHLTRTGTGLSAVGVGLALLARVGEPEDVPYLKVLGQVRDLHLIAVQALDAVDPATAALVWLAQRAGAPAVRELVDALAAGAEPAVPRLLESVLREADGLGPEPARRVAEAVRLAELLRTDGVGETWLVAGAGRLLCRMSSVDDYWSQVRLCPAAVDLYEGFVAHAAVLPPTLDHCALLLSVAQELHSGPSHLLAWEPGRREALLGALKSVLERPAWRAVLVDGEGRRAEWARHLAGQPLGGTSGRLRIEPAVLDPQRRGIVEARILIDGRPLVPEAFGRGSADSPESLVDSGALRATAEPREVRLAEAYCTEGCCGALYVTVRRDGDHVVWSDWSRPAAPSLAPPLRELPEYRFDASAYDAELVRAERDHTWTWPARRTARLIAAGLRDRPELLTRWGARLGWAGTDFGRPDLTAVVLKCRTAPTIGRHGEVALWQHIAWYLPEDGTDPEDRAAVALRRLATEDPRTYGEGVAGG
ncbi:hypothetical protein ACFCV8_19025 [Streptomyces sp. NPDC056347]|uniref:hypothetical protein n=1 Tax=Streptomyces sp. NPDC056347 TaxID=3345790 RepID=UPI0035D9A46F